MSATQKPIRWSVIFFLVLMWALLTIRMDAPWFGHHDANGVFYMTMARNYSLYGASELGFLQLHNYEIPADPQNYNFYLHHPPMISWVLALVGLPMQLSEATSRWAMICATMIYIASFYVLARRLLGADRAFWALMLFGLTPMIAYFGRMPNHEPLVMAFLMPFITIYAQYLRFPTRARWFALVVLAILSMWTAWAAFFFFLMLFIVGLAYRAKGNLLALLTQWRQSLDLIGLMFIIVLATIAVPLFYEIQYAGAIDRLLDMLLFRTSSIGGSRGAPEFNLFGYIGQQLIHMATMMTLFMVVMGFVGFIPLRKHPLHTRLIVLGTLGGGVGFLLFFRNASFIHDYYKYYLMPSFTILACMGIFWAWQLHRYRWIKPAVQGLLLGSTIYAVIIFGGLHISGEQPFPMKVAKAIHANTTVQDTILTNLVRQSPAIEFYAERVISYSIPIDKALEQGMDEGSGVIYVYCKEPLPESLANFVYLLVVDEDCYMIWITPTDEKAS